MKTRLFLASFLGCLLCAASPSLAFQLNPLSQTFSPRGAKATRSYKVVNSDSKPIAVEISVMKREVDAAGQETLSPADDDFLIYPAQILMNPLETQTVRVTWIGEQEPESELSYRLIAEQLPVVLKPGEAKSEQPNKATASVEILMRYAGSLYIQPANAAPDVVLTGLQLERDADGSKWLAIHIKNQGTARQVVEDPKLTVTVGEKTITLQNEALGAIHSHTILAGAERRFRIPWPADLPEGDVSGRLTL